MGSSPSSGENKKKILQLWHLIKIKEAGN